jgi:hypothetical protein
MVMKKAALGYYGARLKAVVLVPDDKTPVISDR